MRSGGVLTVAAILCSGLRCNHPVAAGRLPEQATTASGVTFALPQDDGQWTMASKDYANTRFSTLGEITTANVGHLKVQWTFSTGTNNGNEATPLVVAGTMFFVAPFPNVLFALDTRQGTKKWEYHPQPLQAAKGVACCDLVNRGGTFSDGRVYYATLDNQAVAVDAATGKEAWRVRIGDVHIGETITMAPLVVKGKVLVGNAGGEFGVRGWLQALDAATGRVLWKACSTGPDSEVLIGAEFQPFYEADRQKDLGVTSWPPERWKIGGGNVWGWISYDPALDLIYYGTANPGPWNPDLRPGDNKWTASVFARRPDTGQAVWAYQFTPHDVFDYDGVNESVLVDLPVKGVMRKVLLRAERNGFFYVMDRATGEVLSAEPYVFVNATKSVDLKSGRPVEDWARAAGSSRKGRNICPGVAGAKDWAPMAWSPLTGLVYIPAMNICMDMEGTDANYIAGTPYTGHQTLMYAGPGGHRGELVAWDPVQQKKRWGITEAFPLYGGVLATAGGVVFYGTMDRHFKAVDAASGKLLWDFRTGSGIIAPPMTWRGSDGRQFIAVADGVGGWAGSVVSKGLDPRDGTGDKGFVNAMADLGKFTGTGGTIYVFSL